MKIKKILLVFISSLLLTSCDIIGSIGSSNGSSDKEIISSSGTSDSSTSNSTTSSNNNIKDPSIYDVNE